MTRISKRRLVGASVAASIAVGLVWMGVDSIGTGVEAGAERASRPSTDPAQREAPATPAPAATADTTVPDGAIAMTATFAGTLEAGVSDVARELRWTGRLELGPERGGWRVARLASPRVQVDSSGSGLDQGRFERDLARPWAVRLTPAGGVAEVRFDADTDAQVSALLASLVTAWQWNEPPGATVATWSAEDWTVGGPISARYSRDGAGVVVKRREPQGDDPMRSEATVRYSGVAGRPASIRSEERARFPSEGGVDVIGWRSYACVIELGPTSASEWAWTTAVTPERLSPFEPGSPETAVEEAVPFETALQALRSGADGASTAGRAVLRDQLALSIDASPGGAARIESLVRVGALSGAAQTVAIAALATAHSSSAEQSLANLALEPTIADATRYQALWAATLASHPSPQLAGRFLDAATSDDPLAHAAAMAAGAAAAKLREEAPTDAKAIADALVSTAGSVLPTPGEASMAPAERAPVAVRSDWIAALGNTADSAALPLVLAALEDPEPAVRGRAAFALRFLDPKACLETMAYQMATEPSVTVRGHLLSAAYWMGPAGMKDFVERALLADHSAFVRNKAAVVVAMWAQGAPGFRKTLADALALEKDPWAAEQLQSLLEPGNTDGLSEVSGVGEEGAP